MTGTTSSSSKIILQKINFVFRFANDIPHWHFYARGTNPRNEHPMEQSWHEMETVTSRLFAEFWSAAETVNPREESGVVARQAELSIFEYTRA